MTKVALITGVTGQDGSYLAELLLEKGYEVYGLVRRLSSPNTRNIEPILDRIHLLDGDMTDQSSIVTALRESRPEEIYNLAAQSFVGTSYRQPVLTADVNGLGVVRLLEATRQIVPDAHVYQASTSELFGQVQESPQNESTPFHPRSPYGVAKVFAFWACTNYRESYDMHVSNGILFNHESPRRGLEFVTRKITHGLAQIVAGRAKTVELGNLEAKRDWGYAPEYVEAMWRMLQQKTPGDYVIATGETWSVRQFLELAVERAGLKGDPMQFVKIDARHIRPAEVRALCGDASRARKTLGWTPKVRVPELVKIMMDHDLALVRA